MEEHNLKPWKAFHHREVQGNGWIAYGESQTGSGRTFNEDNYILLPLEDDRLLLAVADGLGGHNAGQIASSLACETLYDHVHQGMLAVLDDTGSHISRALEAIVFKAHQTIAGWSRDIPAFEGMGCTLIAAIISPTKAWFCHVGDSRLYQIGKTNCQQITSDQRVHNTLYTAGQLAESEGTARGGDLEQALGLEEEHHPLKMQQGTITLRDGDSLLLCSDGLYGRVTEQRLADIVSSDQSIITRVQNLIDESLHAGSSDDITAVLVNMVTDSTTL